MTEIYKGVYQFTDILKPMMLSMHQYLMMGAEPVLVQTGAVPQAQAVLPKLKELLKEKQLKYILISHFESDECGGLSLVLNEYPQAIAVCSETTGRQLMGFGIALPGQIKIMSPGETLEGNDFEFKTIGYPSEMHLWEGLLFYESKRNILFSSDLMFGLGETHGQVVENTWEASINASGADSLPDKLMGQKLIGELNAFAPEFVASGHGPCIKISQ